MKPHQATAIRICGAATLVVVLNSIVEIGARVLDLHPVPSLEMSLGLAVLVAFVAFLVANAPRVETAEGICFSALAVIAVLSVLYVYKSGLLSLGFLDVALVLFDYALLLELCRRVLARRAISAS